MTLPKQNIKAETLNDMAWVKPTVDFYINLALNSTNMTETLKFLNSANGVIDEAEYNYVLKPFGDKTSDIIKSGKLPGVVRNFNVITDVKEKNIGEYIQLPYQVHVKTNNPDAVLLRDVKLRKEVQLAMQKKLMEMLQNKEANPQLDIESFVEEYLEDWERDRAIQGKNRLELLNDETNFDTFRINAFYNWWATESFYTVRKIVNGKVEKEIIPPQEGYPIYNGEDFIEDCFGFLRRRYITYDEFFRYYRNQFDEKSKVIVDNMYANYNSNLDICVPYQIFASVFPDKNVNTTNAGSPNVTFSSGNKILMDELTFKYYKEVKFLLYRDSLGQIQEEIVDSNYEFDEAHGDLSITEDYLETVVTALRFGDTNCLYIAPKEEVVQRRDSHDLNKVKIPYGGKFGLHYNITRNPIPNRIIPYEVLLRVFTYALEQTIAKHKGDLTIIPKSALTDGEGGDPKAKIFMMKADNTFIYDDSKIELQTVVQGFKVIGNSGLENYIMALINLINKIRQDAYNVSNMNPERLGQTSQYQPVRNANSNMIQAKTGSALAIYMFHKALERDHNADIEYSKYAWIDGKIGYYQDKTTNKLIEVRVDGIEHMETDYGIYVVDSLKEEARAREFKELVFAAGQNGDLGTAAKGIISDSSVELAKYIDEYQEKKDEFQRQVEQQRNEAIKYQADMLAKSKQDQIDAERNNILIQEEAETARTKMEIESNLQGKLITTAVDNQPKPDNTNSFKQKELDTKVAMNRENNQVKRETNATNERIAKENKG